MNHNFLLISKVLKENNTPVSKVNVNLYGLADRKSITPDDVDPKELQMGIKMEMEHTTDPEVSKKIALDHLAEIKDYYTRLEKMENKAKQEGSHNE